MIWPFGQNVLLLQCHIFTFASEIRYTMEEKYQSTEHSIDLGQQDNVPVPHTVRGWHRIVTHK